MEKKAIYVEKLQAQIKEWNAKLNLLQAKADNASTDVKIKYMKQVEKVKQQKEHIEEQLGELLEAGEDVWEDVKRKLDDAQEELQGFIHKIFPKKELQNIDKESSPEK